MRYKQKNINIVFWNCHGQDNKDENDIFVDFINELLEEKEVDILCLAESKSAVDDVFFENIEKSVKRKKFYCLAQSEYLSGVGRLRMYTHLGRKYFSKIMFTDRFLNVTFLKKFDLCFLHLKSLVSTPMTSKNIEDTIVYQDIQKKTNKFMKFYIGDFNSPPYSDSLLNSTTFNTVRIGEDEGELENYRKVKNEDCNIRINPCWRLLGNSNSGVYGTYLLENANYHNLGYHLLDQVIYDKSLKSYFDESSLEIITGTLNKRLINSDGVLKEGYSDHLPLFFTLTGVV